MTNKEAIKVLKLNMELCRFNPNTGETIPMNKDCEELADACEVAIEALEKRIPKEPIFEGDGYYDGELVYDTWRCPECDSAFEVDFDEYNFCPCCGQAIDWSEAVNE